MRSFLLLIILPFFLSAQESPSPPVPWFTGSLVPPSAYVVKKGHFELEPYLFEFVKVGRYGADWDAHSVPRFYSYGSQTFVIVGLTNWMDIEVIPQVFYNRSQGQSAFGFADLPILLDFQLIEPDAYKYFPGVKVSIGEIFPTGRFQKLDPEKKGTDSTGFGSFINAFNMIFYKVFHLRGMHFLSTTLTLQDGLSAPVHVKGFNTYGGGFHTRGKVYPGNAFSAIFSFEYSFTRNWAFAMDNVYAHISKTRFSGKSGFTQQGTRANMKSPSSEQFSLAPAIEYNFSANLGIVGGVWFTVAGRNSSEFINGLIALEYTY